MNCSAVRAINGVGQVRVCTSRSRLECSGFGQRVRPRTLLRLIRRRTQPRSELLTDVFKRTSADAAVAFAR
jgi:hypothetical protein